MKRLPIIAVFVIATFGTMPAQAGRWLLELEVRQEACHQAVLRTRREDC